MNVLNVVNTECRIIDHENEFGLCGVRFEERVHSNEKCKKCLFKVRCRLATPLSVDICRLRPDKDKTNVWFCSDGLINSPVSS